MTITLRLALDEDGERVQKLVEADGFDIPGIDWSTVYPFWVIAELNGKIVGCIQVCVGLPIGRMEFLCVDKTLPPYQRAKVVHALVTQAMASMKGAGAQAVSIIVPFENKTWKRAMKKRGGVVYASGNLIVKRI